MTITREQVADLQPGDVVELLDDRWPEGTTVRGPLWEDNGNLRCGQSTVRWRDTGAARSVHLKLQVVSRLPRNLYVNHPRTAAAIGDVVRDADSASPKTWTYEPLRDSGIPAWWTWDSNCGRTWVTREAGLPARLRLLVDGETGQVVP